MYFWLQYNRVKNKSKRSTETNEHYNFIRGLFKLSANRRIVLSNILIQGTKRKQ